MGKYVICNGISKVSWKSQLWHIFPHSKPNTIRLLVVMQCMTWSYEKIHTVFIFRVIWKNLTRAQWIRSSPKGSHRIHWTSAVFSNIAFLLRVIVSVDYTCPFCDINHHGWSNKSIYRNLIQGPGPSTLIIYMGRSVHVCTYVLGGQELVYVRPVK